MKSFSLALMAMLMIGTGSVAKADLLCVNGLKLEIQGQQVEIAERINSAGALVRDSIIDGVRSDSNVFIHARGGKIVVEVRINIDQAPVKEGVDHHTDMEYMIELDAKTNNVLAVEFSRHQQIDYGNPIPISTEMSFYTIQKGSCDAQ